MSPRFQVVCRSPHLVFDDELLGDIVEVAFAHAFEPLSYVFLNQLLVFVESNSASARSLPSGHRGQHPRLSITGYLFSLWGRKSEIRPGVRFKEGRK